MFQTDATSDEPCRVSLFCTIVGIETEDEPSNGRPLPRCIAFAGTLLNRAASSAEFGPSDRWALSAFVATTIERARILHEWVVHGRSPYAGRDSPTEHQRVGNSRFGKVVRFYFPQFSTSCRPLTTNRESQRKDISIVILLGYRQMMGLDIRDK